MVALTLPLPALQRFNTLYQQRLRAYVIHEQENTAIMAKIPNNQFAVCLAYNFFNFKPFEVIKQYLEEIYCKLLPGGVLIMTIKRIAFGVFCVSTVISRLVL